jgi:hypothetical protein
LSIGKTSEWMGTWKTLHLLMKTLWIFLWITSFIPLMGLKVKFHTGCLLSYHHNSTEWQVRTSTYDPLWQRDKFGFQQRLPHTSGCDEDLPNKVYYQAW